MDYDSPYDGDLMVSPAAFLGLGAVPLNELTVVMDVRPVHEAPCESKKCVVRWCSTRPRRAAFGGRSVVERVRIPTMILPFVDVTRCTLVRRRSQAKFQSLRRILLRAVASMVWDTSYKCLSDSHVVCHSAIAGKSPGEAMTSAFILAKHSRSPLKNLRGRLIPTAVIGDSERPPSPHGEGAAGLVKICCLLLRATVRLRRASRGVKA
jgi:hypothetical protein